MLPGAASPWRWVVDLAAGGLWVGTAAMAFFVAARIIRPDTNIFLIWANSYTFWIYLPAYAVLAFALLFRRWWLLGAAVFVAAFHLAWVLPDYRPAESIPAEARGAPTIRLMTANVFFHNADYGPVTQEILDADPDVLFLQEVSPEVEASLRAAGLDEVYPYREVGYENQFFGLALYSKLPLRDVEQVIAGGRPFIRATIDVEGTPVRLYDVHPTSPGLGRALARHWNEGWRTITTEVAGEPGAVIVAGDFNMNQHHTWYRELKSDGLDNCHEERGRGNATTWPKQRKLRPIRIDHVFHSDEVVCLSVREGVGEGSDHRPVIVDLAILPGR